MKKMILSAGAALGAAALVFGTDKVWSYWCGTRQALNDGLDDNVPVGLEQSRAKALAEQEGARLAEYEDKVLDLKARGDAANRKAADLAGRLDQEKRILAQAKSLLEDRAASYAVGGRSYAADDVGRDAMRRLERCRELQEQVDFHRTLSGELAAAAQKGEATLAEARRRQGQLQMRLAQLDARHTNAQALQEVASLVGSLSIDPPGGRAGAGELERVVQNIDRRVGRMERRASVASGTAGDDTVDYGDATEGDAAARIAAFLDGGGSDGDAAARPRATAGDRPVPAAPTTQPLTVAGS